METFLPKTPLTYRELIARSLKLYANSFSSIFLLSLLMAITTFIPRLLSDIIGEDVLAALPPQSPERLWFLVITIISLIFFIGILWRMFCAARGKHEPFSQDLRVGSQKALAVFLGSFLYSLILFAVSMVIFGIILFLHYNNLLFNRNVLGAVWTILFFCAQLVLIIYVTTLFIFTVPSIVIENWNVIAALEHSASLVWNHWWRTFSVQMTPWVCYFCILLLFRFLFGIPLHIYFLESPSHPIWVTFLNIFLYALFIPWTAALLLLQLKDLEHRKKPAARHRK